MGRGRQDCEAVALLFSFHMAVPLDVALGEVSLRMVPREVSLGTDFQENCRWASRVGVPAGRVRGEVSLGTTDHVDIYGTGLREVSLGAGPMDGVPGCRFTGSRGAPWREVRALYAACVNICAAV